MSTELLESTRLLLRDDEAGFGIIGSFSFDTCDAGELDLLSFRGGVNRDLGGSFTFLSLRTR